MRVVGEVMDDWEGYLVSRSILEIARVLWGWVYDTNITLCDTPQLIDIFIMFSYLHLREK